MNSRPLPSPVSDPGAACRNGGSALRGVSGVTLLMLVSMVLATSPALGAKPSVAVGEQVRLAECRLPRSGQQSVTESCDFRKDSTNQETHPGACVGGCASAQLDRSRLLVARAANPRKPIVVRSQVRYEQMNLPPPSLA